MAKLPTASQIDRPTFQPRAPRSGVVSYTPSGGQGLQIIGKALGDYAEQAQAEQDAIEEAHVASEATLAYAKTLNEIKDDPDFANLPQKYMAKMDANNQQLLSQVSPRIRAKMTPKLKALTAGGMDNVFNDARQKRNESGEVDYLKSNDVALGDAINAPSLADANLIIKAQQNRGVALANGGIINPAKQYTYEKKLKDEVLAGRWANKPDEKKLEIIQRATAKPTPTGQSASPISTIMKNELAADGKVTVHSDGDGQAIGGINSESYPQQFAEAKEILATKGQDAAKEYISAFYQKEIVDKNGITSLPPAVQTIVADGMTNHWGGFQKELLDAAKSGKSPQELIAMRRAEYQRLATENPAKYGKNLAGWNSRLDSLSGGGYAKTDSEFDDMDAEMQQKIIAGKDTIIQKAVDNKMAENPSQFIADLGDGKYSDVLDAAQTEKYKGNAVALQEKQARNAAEVRIATNAVYHKDAYDKIQAAVAASDPSTAFQLVGDLRQNLLDQGQPTQFADDVRASLLKTNPYSEEEKAQIFTGVLDRFNNLAEDTSTLEDVVHLQQDMMTAKLSGVKGMDSYLKKLSPLIQSKANNEQGADDVGWKFFGEEREPYDAGYQVIQDYLEKQDKETDLPLKAGMMQSFIRQADNIPEEILKDPEKRDSELVKISNGIIAGAAQSGNTKNIPIAAIQYLREHPDTAEEFDKRSFPGAAAKILGRQ